jgi:ribosomal protein S18 acetylase RimI-like enzyme
MSLSVEDPGGLPMTPEKVRLTIAELLAHPDKGQIMLFEAAAGEVVGYAILINFWSNEFGGNITTIDELYVKAAWRSQGIGSDFIRFLEKTRLAGAVALQLEVLPENIRAQRLYQKLGFEKNSNQSMVKHLLI